MMIFTAAVLAFPSRIKEKAWGLLGGLAGIFVINQIRRVSLFYIGSYVPSIFDTTRMKRLGDEKGWQVCCATSRRHRKRRGK
jgi:exosortase/archaeosortase family protein